MSMESDALKSFVLTIRCYTKKLKPQVADIYDYFELGSPTLKSIKFDDFTAWPFCNVPE